jgi:16S rRNA (uracil1498-N3)-methyltransferase
MATPRIFHPSPISEQTVVELSDSAAAHLVRVLRMGPGEPLLLFDGQGQEYEAHLDTTTKKRATAAVSRVVRQEPEPSLTLHLGQVISKGERMDFTIQKATELGISEITPLWSQRCEVRLNQERLQKKCEHWQKVAQSACEQSGRCRVPTIHPPKTLSQWTEATQAESKLVLHPHNQKALREQTTPNSLALLVGPEGGFTEEEIRQCQQHGFDGLTLGPRVLRTETAALAALAVLQYQWGDF